jgi:hypothetical protein
MFWVRGSSGVDMSEEKVAVARAHHAKNYPFLTNCAGRFILVFLSPERLAEFADPVCKEHCHDERFARSSSWQIRTRDSAEWMEMADMAYMSLHAPTAAHRDDHRRTFTRCMRMQRMTTGLLAMSVFCVVACTVAYVTILWRLLYGYRSQQ